MDGGLHHLDGGGAGFQPDAVPPALLDDLRLFQRQLVDAGHHDAVARGLHLLERGANFVVGALCPGQRKDAGHQSCLVADVEARLLAEHLIEHLRPQQHRDAHHAVRKIPPAEGGALHRLAVQRLAGKGHILHPGNALGAGHGGLIHLGLQPVAPVQHGHPAGQGKIQLPDRELVQHALQNVVEPGRIEVDAAHGQNGAAIRFFQRFGQCLRLGRVGVGAIEQHHKGLAQRFQLGHHPLLGGEIVFAGDLADGAIRRYHHADGGVVPDDLPGARLSGQVKGDLLIVPRAFHHAGLVVFLVAHGPLYHIAHTIDEPHPALAPTLQRQGHRAFRDELGLRGHDGTPCRRLGQLIPGPEAGSFRPQDRQHQLLHKPLDEGAFAGAHRPHHSDQNIAARPRAHLAADVALLQTLFQNALPSPPVLEQFMRNRL